MDLKEMTDLIAIRQYMANAAGNYNLNKDTVNYLAKLILMVDIKLVELLQNSEFKKYVNYQDVDKAVIEARLRSDIKSGIKR